MIQALIAGIWGCLVALGAVYFVHSSHSGGAAKDEHADKAVQLIKLNAITVPVVGPEGIEGYLLAVIGVNFDKTALKTPNLEVEPVLQDVAFRTFYGVEAMKYRKPRKNDLDTISNDLKSAMNARLGGEAVKSVLLQEFSFVPKEQSRGVAK